MVETRNYPLPAKYLNEPLALIETPGPSSSLPGRPSKARVIGVITFVESFAYQSELDWRKDVVRHLVEPGHRVFGYSDEQTKWGWVVGKIRSLRNSVLAPQPRGIVFASRVEVCKEH